jgi:hypothetical protein
MDNSRSPRPISPSNVRPAAPAVRLGGFVILPRMLDKAAPPIAGKNGEFNYDAPFDQRIINFLGFEPAALLEQLAAGKATAKFSNGSR